MNEQLVKLIDKLSYDGTLYSFGHIIYKEAAWASVLIRKLITSLSSTILASHSRRAQPSVLLLISNLSARRCPALNQTLGLAAQLGVVPVVGGLATGLTRRSSGPVAGPLTFGVQPHLEELGSCAWLRRGVRQAGGHSRLPVRKKRAPCGALNSRSSCESTPMCLGPRHEISIVKETSRGKQ